MMDSCHERTPLNRKTITVRLPSDLYRMSARLAKKRKVSMNALVAEGLTSLHAREAQKMLWDEYTLLGEDVTDTDVSYTIHAQSEVMLRDDP